MTYTSTTHIQPKTALLVRLGVAGLLFSLMLGLLSGTANAANVTVSLISSAGTVQQNGTFNVDVRVTAGAAKILDANGEVTYNASQLELLNVTYLSGMDWTGSAQSTGAYEFYRIYPGGQSGTISVVRLAFKAKAASGTSTISLSNALISDGDNPPPSTHNASMQGVGVTLAAATTTPSAPSTPSSGGGGSGSTAPTYSSGGSSGGQANPSTTANQGTPVTNEAELAAANTSAEQAAKTIDDDNAKQIAAATTPANASKLSTPLIVSVGLLVLVAAVGTLVIRRVQASRTPAYMAIGDEISVTSGRTTPEPETPSTPDDTPIAKAAPYTPPAAGSVITPDSSSQDSEKK